MSIKLVILIFRFICNMSEPTRFFQQILSGNKLERKANKHKRHSNEYDSSSITCDENDIVLDTEMISSSDSFDMYTYCSYMFDMSV